MATALQSHGCGQTSLPTSISRVIQSYCRGTGVPWDMDRHDNFTMSDRYRMSNLFATLQTKHFCISLRFLRAM